MLLEVTGVDGQHVVSHYGDHSKDSERVGESQQSLVRDHSESVILEKNENMQISLNQQTTYVGGIFEELNVAKRTSGVASRDVVCLFHCLFPTPLVRTRTDWSNRHLPSLDSLYLSLLSIAQHEAHICENERHARRYAHASRKTESKNHLLTEIRPISLDNQQAKPT